MPNNIKVSDMEAAVELTKDDLVMIAQPNIDPEDPTAEVESYSSKKTTVEDLANTTAKDIQFTSALQTKSKTITGAINEAAEVGKKSEELEVASFSTRSSQWVDNGTTISDQTVYKTDAETYNVTFGESLCTYTVEGYDNVTFRIKQDGNSTETQKAYVVLGNGFGSIDLNNSWSYAHKYNGEVLSDFTEYTFDYLNGGHREFQVLYHVEPKPVSGATATIDLNDGEWVQSGNVCGIPVYKSDAGSYHISGGASRCRITISGVTSFTIYCKPSTNYGDDYAYIGALDQVINPSSQATYVKRISGGWTQYDATDYTCSTDEHTIEVLYKKSNYGYENDDRVYIYFVINGEPNTNRGYVCMIPGTVHTPQGEVFNNYNDNYALGQYSHAEGGYTKALGNNSHAEGSSTKAFGDGSHAEGQSNKALGSYSHVEGNDNEAQGSASHVEGGQNKVLSEKSHAEGTSNIAYDAYSHVEGSNNFTKGYYSHAEGYKTQTFGNSAHAEGSQTSAGSEIMAYNNSEGAHAEGLRTQASNWAAHAEGTDTIASHIGAHAEGRDTKAIQEGSHAEGMENTASGQAAHAEGKNSTASGISSHAEGEHTTAYSNNSHAEGYYTVAAGEAAHAEGKNAQAVAEGAHAEGLYTVASGTYQHVQGKYNIADSSKAFIIGNGTADVRSNALVVDWSGNMTLGGDITPGTSLNTTATTIGSAINEIVARIPAAPTTDGNYILSVTVSSGVPTYSWIASPT